MYTVRWSPVFSPSTDFLMPGEGSGMKSFPAKDKAERFAKKLRQEGIVVRGTIPILGRELQVRTRKK